MAALDAMQVADERGFQQRVAFFLKKAAVAIMAEALSTAGHAERVVYAKTVLDGAASVEEATRNVVTNPTIEAAGLAATDGDIEFTVNSMFNAFAGFESGPA